MLVTALLNLAAIANSLSVEQAEDLFFFFFCCCARCGMHDTSAAAAHEGKPRPTPPDAGSLVLR